MKNVEKKREKEKKVVREMISLYCHDLHHTNKGSLCKECSELAYYAQMRSDKCPFMEKKTFCSNCKVHCYEPKRREEIRRVMRYAGPRMIFHHPVMAIHHIISSKLEKRRLEKI